MIAAAAQRLTVFMQEPYLNGFGIESGRTKQVHCAGVIRGREQQKTHVRIRPRKLCPGFLSKLAAEHDSFALNRVMLSA
jgi:hypothetical protein